MPWRGEAAEAPFLSHLEALGSPALTGQKRLSRSVVSCQDYLFKNLRPGVDDES